MQLTKKTGGVMKTVILGAGITGLAAAYKTKGTVYEATSSPGGICRSYYEGGYRFERGGGHWIFGVDREVLDFLDQFGTFKRYKRDAGVYINKTFPYPIQTYFDVVDEPSQGTMKYDHFEKFGCDLGRLFFYPFNEKYTSGLYNKIAPQDPQKTPLDGQGYNSEFLYPEGGLDRLIDAIAVGLDIRYHKKVTSIHPDEKMLYFEDGDSRRYDELISTLPLNVMCHLLGLKQIHTKLPHNSTIVLNIGATPGRNFPKEHWLYIPYSKAGFHRVGFYSNVDKSFAPKNRVGLYVEWAFRDKVPDTSLAFNELAKWGFIKRVERSSFNVVDVAYTWQWSGSQERENLIAMVEDNGITQIGRYGRWRFCGIAESIKMGLLCSQ